ncbi:MAG: lipopolysaccharide biosynthesis protein [Dehalococcoidia bacterium]
MVSNIKAFSGYSWFQAKAQVFLRPGTSLSQRIVRAGFWAMVMRVALAVANAAKMIVLARILAPGDFGLMGIAMLVLALMDIFTRTGFKAALVQQKEDIKPYLNTAWTIEVLRNLVLAGGLVLAAPLIARFFDTPDASLIIRVMTLSLVLAGLNNIAIIYFLKELEFHRQFLHRFAFAGVEVVVAIVLALILHSVWALVWGALAGSVAQLLASYFLHSYRPRPAFDWTKAKELYGYGKWIFGTGILSYLMLHLDQLVVGKFLGVASLGFYRMAYNVSQMTGNEIRNVVNQVAFPAYSKLQEEMGRMRNAYLETVQWISFLTFPTMAGLFMVSEEFVHVVLGDKWVPMIATLQVLILWGLVGSIGGTRRPVFEAVGRPDISTKLVLATTITLAAVVYPMTLWWGIAGTALAVLVSSLLFYPVGLVLVLNILNCPVVSYMKAMFAPTLCTGVMVGVLYLAKRWVFTEPTLLGMISLILLGAVTFLAAALLADQAFHLGIRRKLQERLRPG